MLYSIDKEQLINYIPHQREYEIWRSRLSDEEYQAIVNELNNRIANDDIHTAGWIPGSDWTDTVFQPIYEKACLLDEEAAGKCFGLILWIVMMEHPDAWSFGRYEKDGIPIESLTYFKVDVTH
ncbi:MAG: hypothetical protein V3W18_14040 [candidate division Zixibacteria bacterium]